VPSMPSVVNSIRGSRRGSNKIPRAYKKPNGTSRSCQSISSGAPRS
jgi:hypothetical protein